MATQTHSTGSPIPETPINVGSHQRNNSLMGENCSFNADLKKLTSTEPAEMHYGPFDVETDGTATAVEKDISSRCVLMKPMPD